MVPDSGTAAMDAGPIIDEPPWDDDLLSDFEDPTRAIVLRLGWPYRNGYWYAVNDGSRSCMQVPRAEAQSVAAGTTPATYVGATPPTPSPGPSGARALRAQWKGCTDWGAGIAADFNAGMNFNGVYTGPKVAYDLYSWVGVTFWAMAMPNTDVNLRVMLPLRATLRVQDGGACDEADAGAGKCGDHWGEPVKLPANGTWTRITVRFSDATFRQQGSGAAVPWDKTDVIGVQIRSLDVGQTYDFWIDDVYLVRPNNP
jgi:hypothetical protein